MNERRFKVKNERKKTIKDLRGINEDLAEMNIEIKLVRLTISLYFKTKF
jgi:hypothetical protein